MKQIKLLISLTDEYKRLLLERKKYEQWKIVNINNKEKVYDGEIISKARLERTALMLRQTMLDRYQGWLRMKTLIINLTSLIIGYLLYRAWQVDKYKQDDVDMLDHLDRVINQY